jgi:Lhr-like helicase
MLFTSLFIIKVWGVSLLIWIMFFISILTGLGILLYWNREKLKFHYYTLRYPERTIKVVMHYKNNQFKEFWRLIPPKDTFEIEGKQYSYSDKGLLRENEFFAEQKKEDIIFKFEGKEYIIKSDKILKKRGRIYPEIHYFFGYPLPLDFDITKKDIDFNTEQLTIFKENDLFVKLLTLDDTNMKILLLFVVCIINLLASLFIIAKLMGWIKA